MIETAVCSFPPFALVLHQLALICMISAIAGTFSQESNHRIANFAADEIAASANLNPGRLCRGELRPIVPDLRPNKERGTTCTCAGRLERCGSRLS